MKKIGFSFLACLLLSSCASNAYYRAATNSWVGAPAPSLFAAWGPPVSNLTQNMPGNTIYYVYDRRISGVEPTTTTGPTTKIVHKDDGTTVVEAVAGQTTGGGTYFYECRTNFGVNKANGIILNSSFVGNDCACTKQRAMELQNPAKPPLFP